MIRVLLLLDGRLGDAVENELFIPDSVWGVELPEGGVTPENIDLMMGTYTAMQLPNLCLLRPVNTPRDIDQVLAYVKPDLILSAGWRHILPPKIVDNYKCVNLHTSYLPHNRGAHPNVWAIMDDTPAGATLHWMDEGIDTGNILERRQVPHTPDDTAWTLYWKQIDCGVEIVMDYLRLLNDDPQTTLEIVGKSQAQFEGCESPTHRIANLAHLDEINGSSTWDEVWRQIRARTFCGYDGPYFHDTGRRYIIRPQWGSVGDNEVCTGWEIISREEG